MTLSACVVLFCVFASGMNDVDNVIFTSRDAEINLDFTGSLHRCQ